MHNRLYSLTTFATLLLVAIIALSFSFTSISVNKETSADKYTNPVVIIDPGHGGEDGGAVSKFDIPEKDINLQIALKLKSFLQANNFDVIMTRETDTALYDADCSSNKKQSDLHKRVEIFNSNNRNVVISIHQNNFLEPQYSGAQVFYSPNDKRSEHLAECIRASITGLIQKENDRKNKKAGSEIFILNNTNVPAVLVECGFLSNDTEAKILLDEKYQSQLAYCICLGFLEYYHTNYK